MSEQEENDERREMEKVDKDLGELIQLISDVGSKIDEISRKAEFVKRLESFFGPLINGLDKDAVENVATRNFVADEIIRLNTAIRSDLNKALARVEKLEKQQECKTAKPARKPARKGVRR